MSPLKPGWPQMLRRQLRANQNLLATSWCVAQSWHFGIEMNWSPPCHGQSALVRKMPIHRCTRDIKRRGPFQPLNWQPHPTGSHHDIKMRNATLLRLLLELSLWKERQNLYHRGKPQVKASNETSSTQYSSVAVWGSCFVLLCWPALLVVKQGMVRPETKSGIGGAKYKGCTGWLRHDHVPWYTDI